MQLPTQLLRCFQNLKTSAISVFLSLLLATVVALPASAQQWRFEPSIAAGFEYDDNPFLDESVANEESVNGIVFDVQAGITRTSPLSRLSITPRFMARNFDDSSVADSDAASLNVDYAYNGQRLDLRLRGKYADETVRTAERGNVDFDIDDPDDIPTDDSAQLQQTRERKRLQLRPSLSYETGEKSSVIAGLEYLDLEFPSEPGSTLFDFSVLRVTAGYDYRWTERDSFVFSAYTGETEFDDAARDNARSSGASIGYVRRLSENTRLKLAAGADRSEDRMGSSQTEPIGEISLVTKLERSTVLAAFQRSVNGDGGGALTARNTYSLQATRRMSEKLSLGGGIRAYQTRSIEGGTANVASDERDYTQLRALLTWQLTRAFSVDFDYHHTIIDNSDVPGDASSNQIQVLIRYAPRR